MDKHLVKNVNFNIRKLEPGEILHVDGIDYRGVAFVEMYLDGKEYRELPGLGDTLIVPDELMKSETKEGLLLIFTCGCGIADDGGWDGVDVIANGDKIEWQFDTEIGQVHWIFNAEEYRKGIINLRLQIENLNPDIIEPTSVVFPEDWENRGMEK